MFRRRGEARRGARAPRRGEAAGCRRANHCPLMPLLQLRQAHSCRPRETTPVARPGPRAASGVRGRPEHGTRPRSSEAPSHSGARAGDPPQPSRQRRRGLPCPAAGLGTRVARDPPPAHTHTLLLFSRSRLTSSTTQPRFRPTRTNRSSPARKGAGAATPPHRSRSRPRPVHTCLLPKAHDSPRSTLHRICLFSSFLTADLYCTRPPRPAVYLTLPYHHGIQNYFGAAWAVVR